MSKKVIFSDFFGVISSSVASVWFNNNFNKYIASKLTKEYCSKADIGINDMSTTFSLLSKLTNKTSKEIEKEWLELSIINKEMINYLKELKKGHKIYLLTNAMEDFVNKIINRNNIRDIFDKVYISSSIKLVKPSKEFFNYVLRDLNLKGKDCIMIDDNGDNINGANKCSINGIVFTSVSDLKAKVKEIEKNS